jgi:hypothetical protein
MNRLNEQTLEDSNLSDQHSEEEETIGLQSIHQYEEGSVIEELQSNENDSILSSHISSSKEKNWVSGGDGRTAVQYSGFGRHHGQRA